MSLYRFSEQTRFLDEFDGTISAGLAVLNAIEPLEQVDHYVHRPSTWWHIATMISNAYSNRAQHSPSLELYEKSVKFQLGLVAATGESIYFFEDLLLGSWSSSRLAAMYIGQYEFSESADLFAIEEGLARSGIALSKLGQLDKRPTSFVLSVYETHYLVPFAHYQATNISQHLNDALKYSTIVVESYDLQAEADQLASPECWALRFWRHGSLLEAENQRYRRKSPDEARRALSQAVDFGRWALSLCYDNDRIRARVMCSVATWLCEQMEFNEDPHFGGEGVKLVEEALELNGSDPSYNHSTKSHILDVQYSILKGKGKMGMAASVLEQAISEGEKAVEMFNTSDRLMGQAYKSLADMQKKEFLDSYKADNLQANENFKKAAEAEKASLLVRIPAARESGLFHVWAKEFPKAHVFFQYAISLLPIGEQHSIPSQDLQTILRQSSNIAEYAASIALAA
jgi:tetratricopeptide (TPR) repeat protein